MAPRKKQQKTWLLYKIFFIHIYTTISLMLVSELTMIFIFGFMKKRTFKRETKKLIDTRCPGSITSQGAQFMLF